MRIFGIVFQIVILIVGAGASAVTEEQACARLLTMTHRLYLAHSRPGLIYPSGFGFAGPTEASDLIATLFGSLRTPENERLVIRELDRVDLPARVKFLHRLSLGFSFTTLNLAALMTDPALYETQQTHSILDLLQGRASFVREQVLPRVLTLTADLQPRYVEELVAIAANFSNVPTAYDLAVTLVDAAWPGLDAHRVHGGRLRAADLARIKYHGLANQLLEDNTFDRASVTRALDQVSELLRREDPEEHLAWLIPQLAYRVQVGFTVRGTRVFPRVAWTAGELTRVLPPDLAFATAHFPQLARDIGDLVAAREHLPSILSEEQTQRLRRLLVRH